MKQIILIGWAPATWKSTLANSLSEHLCCPWLSGDFIRNWLQNILEKEKNNNLFIFKWTAKEHYQKFNIQETLDMEYKRDTEVFKWIKSFINNNNDWDFYIIEWISIHPDFVDQLASDKIKVIPIFIVDEDEKRVESILQTRWLWWKDPKTRKIEAQYLKLTNKYYLESSRKLDKKYFILDKKRENTLNEIKEYLENIIK
jgi:2-phosphoglycerate kinase